MSPETIPWILCGALCLVPVLIGSVTFFLWTQLTNRLPSRDVSVTVDADGRKHTITDWSMLAREEKKIRREEEKE
jgi:hypothetical protein